MLLINAIFSVACAIVGRSPAFTHHITASVTGLILHSITYVPRNSYGYLTNRFAKMNFSGG
jgi:hypothetical protein